MLRLFFAALLCIHGAIHLLGFIKAFELAAVGALKDPISRRLGVLWLLAGAALIAGAVLFAASSRSWWLLAGPATALSIVLIAVSWRDAKYGLIADAIALVPLTVAVLGLRDTSFRAIYDRQASRALAQSASAAPVTEAELAPLPPLLQTFLRRAGVVGKPRVRAFRARWEGEMRSAPGADWMAVRAEQYNFFDPRERLFLIRGARYGLPFEGLHIYSGESATMQIRLASVLDVVDARGPEMNQSETVTLFNDMCLIAPATLIGAGVRWEELGDHALRGTFTNAGHTISAVLSFDDIGDLVGFTSGDRYLSADGKNYRKLPWTTPVRGYREYRDARLPELGEAIWTQPEGDFVYARLRLVDVEYNPFGPITALETEILGDQR